MLSTAFTANAAPVSESQFQTHALDIAQHVVIEACAGSGKTWLLTARLLRLLLAGTPPQAILAITFTRKATQEMKQRLADMLAMLYDIHHAEREPTLAALGLTDTPTLRAQLTHCWEQAFNAGEWPTIATFHEWFASVRRAAPFSLQNAPAAVLTQDEYLHTMRAWQAFWKLSQQDAAIAAHMKTAIAELGLNGFETALKAVFERRAEWSVFLEHGGEPITVAQAHAAFEALLQAKSAAQLARACQPMALAMRGFVKPYLAIVGKEMNKRGHALAAALKQYAAYECAYPNPLNESGDSDPAQAGALARCVTALLDALSNAKFSLPAHSRIVFAPMRPALAKSEGGVEGFYDAYVHAHAVLGECHAAFETLRLLPAHHGVLYCANALIAAYQNDKLAHGVVDFTDLELEALSVLQATQGTHTSRDLPWTRIQHVLLDEFQDTNPIQWQALQAFLTPLLTEAKSGGLAASVFMVGDPKQSIYRFRRADPVLFGHVGQWLHEQFGAVVLRTQRTRRNAQSVNALVNGVFVTPEPVDAIFAEQFTLSRALGQVRALPLISAAGGEDEGDDDSAVPLRSNLLSQPIDAQFGAASVFAAEAEQIAENVLRWRAEHPQLPWAQVMVLARRRAPLQAVAAALHALGVPCISDEKGGFFQNPEVADMAALLAALHNPLDALSTLHALRSPVFGISNAELSQLAAHWQSVKAQSTAAWCALGGLDAPWARHALAWFKQWQWLARHLPTHDALDAMIKQGQLIERFCEAAPAQRAPWIVANMQQLLRTALDVDGGRYPSLAKFIAHIQALSASDTLVAEPLIAPDAVRLSTIHSAKGLEAELVILMDTCSRPKSDPAIYALLDWPATQASPSYFGVALGQTWAGSFALQAATSSKAASALEQHTLLYVALTRAKGAVWVSGTARKNKVTVYGTVQAAMQALEPLQAQPQAGVQLRKEAPSSPTAPPDHSPAIEAYSKRQSSSIASLLSAPPQAAPYVPPYLEPHATQRGKAVHSALQAYMQYGSLPDAAALLVRGTLPLSQLLEALGDAATMVRELKLEALRTHPAVQRLAIEQAWMRSQNGAPAEILRPDLVAFGEQLCWLIDYKTHFKPNHAAAEEYAAQLRGYLSLLPSHAQAYLLTSEGECWAFDPREAKPRWQCVAPPWCV